jgi:small conductance mechanosensitive channel
MGSVSHAADILDAGIRLSIGTTIAKIGAVIVIAFLVVRIGTSLINRLMAANGKVPGLAFDEPRRKTLTSLLQSTLRYVTSIVAFLMILDLLGIDTKALLGGAAVLGLAVGFGAQNLVRDVITGFFLIYERQYDVGDYVSIAGVSGIVEQIGLRTTIIREFSGDVHTIPNGLIEKTANKSRRGARALVEVPVPYSADLRKAMDLLGEVCRQMAEERSEIQEGPRVLGVSQLGESGVVLAVWARTEPMQQWGVERELRLRIKEALDAAGIELPYPRLVVYEGGERKGAKQGLSG